MNALTNARIVPEEKPGRRGSDEPFYRLMRASGDAVLRLLGVAAGYPYKLQAETLKAKRVSPDLVAIPVTGQGNLVFLEFQGYPDPFIRHRLAAAALLYCCHNDYRGPFTLAVIYTERSCSDAALRLKGVDGEGNPTIQGWPREIILEELRDEELADINPELLVLAPYTVPKNLPKDDLAVRVKGWGERVKDLDPERRPTELIDLMAIFLLNRFRNITREEVLAMMNFDLADTAAGRDIRWLGFQEGREEGREEGLEKGREEGRVDEARENLLDLLSVRFGPVSQDVSLRIGQVGDLNVLKDLLRAVIQVPDLAAFQSKLPELTAGPDPSKNN
ncbi:MAG: DUF2887 domain-containing protein [Deltaproteobacteria bacterium]|nr:DUF2887 domain-containing protein [Deltaproteobacteria bacterium]